MTCYTPSAILGANDTQTNKKNKSYRLSILGKRRNKQRRENITAISALLRTHVSRCNSYSVVTWIGWPGIDMKAES